MKISDNLDKIKVIIKNAIKEDIDTIDVTSDNIFDDKHFSNSKLISKDNGIVSGLEIIELVISEFTDDYEITFFNKSGDFVKKGDYIADINCNTRALLKSERIFLNIIQRMSGIATKTFSFVRLIPEKSKTKILDTRKTVPNLRILDRIAVTDGKGTNHRFNLSDMSMIKDNHIKSAGGIKKAVEIIKNKFDGKIEVEVESYEMFEEALETSCDIIMLDNMTDIEIVKCIKHNKGKLLEASGNMSLNRIKGISDIGLDYISVGELTHSVKAFDISLKF